MAQNNLLHRFKRDGKENAIKISKPLKDVANIPLLRNSGTLNSKTTKVPEECFRKKAISVHLSTEFNVRKPSNSVSLNGTSCFSSQTKPKVKSSVRDSKSSIAGSVNKIVPKRIPSYDYKARYNDLLAKHETLKSKFVVVKEELIWIEQLPHKYGEKQSEIHCAKLELQNKRKEFEVLRRETNEKTRVNEYLAKTWDRKKDKLREMNSLCKKLDEDRKSTMIDLLELRQQRADTLEVIRSLSEELTVIKNRLLEMYEERKVLQQAHHTLMDARGNIRVFCRVRPALESEESRSVCEYTFLDEATLEIFGPEGKSKAASHTFTVDRVFHSKSTQQDVFEVLATLVQSALDGYNVCILTYGQTGSGKTYTMEGTANNLGIIPRTVDFLFNSFKNYKLLGWEYEVKLSFLEICNEVVYDLLRPNHKNVEIGLSKSEDEHLSNVSELIIPTADQLHELVQKAKMNRGSLSNDELSGSHSVTRINLRGYRKNENDTSHSTISLVDLAGSESPNSNVGMNDAEWINRSWSELMNNLMALAQKQEHTPNSDSKLTNFLMPHFRRNSKTVLFVCVSPFQDCFAESIKSLRFANSVCLCKTAKIRRNQSIGTPTKASA